MEKCTAPIPANATTLSTISVAMPAIFETPYTTAREDCSVGIMYNSHSTRNLIPFNLCMHPR